MGYFSLIKRKKKKLYQLNVVKIDEALDFPNSCGLEKWCFFYLIVWVVFLSKIERKTTLSIKYGQN